MIAMSRLIRRPLIRALILGFSLLPVSAVADQCLVAVASNFAGPMNAIEQAFEATTPHDVVIAPGSSGKIYAQIVKGAPFDVFFSADQAKPLQLESQGWIVPGSRFTYAQGRLVLWSPREKILADGPAVLGSDRYRKLALANPRLAPYGAAAVEVLRNLNMADMTRARWVQGENIAQTFMFVQSGNAELGFIARSQLIDYESGARGEEQGPGSSWQVPAKLHSPIRQDVVLLKRGGDNPCARDLLQFMRSDPARRILDEFGYDDEEGYTPWN